MKRTLQMTLALLFLFGATFAQKGIVHDAEYYILESSRVQLKAE